MKRTAKITAAMAAACVFTAGCAAGQPLPQGMRALRDYDVSKMTEYQFERVGGGRLSLSQLPSKLLLVTFFTTWSDVCIIQMKALSNLFERDSHRGFMVVGVAMDLDGALALEPFVRQFRIAFPVVFATEGITSGRSPFGRVPTVPMTFVFADGKLKWVYTGLIPASEMDALFDMNL
ncbi:MAG: TlpA disulfide reductase family protein [Myxococcota bacterium]|jgi:peroxiredoxin